MKHRKLIAFLSVIAAGMILMAGCGDGDRNDNGGGNGAAKLDGAALADKLVSDVSFEDQLSKVDDDTALMLYGLTADQIASANVYVGSGATAEEVAVIEGVDEDSAKVIEEQVRARVQSQLDDYKDYIPEEVPKLENPVIKKDGNFVILCVSGDNDTAESVIKEMMK